MLELLRPHDAHDDPSRARSYELLRRLQAVAESADDKERRAIACERMRYWNGDIAHLVPGMPYEDHVHKELKPKFVPNLTQQALRQLSYLWDVAPRRSVPDDPEATAQWERILWQFDDAYDEVLADAWPLARWLGQVHVLVGYTPRVGFHRDWARHLSGQTPPQLRSDEDGLELTRILPQNTVVLPVDGDPRFPQAIAYRHQVVHGRGVGRTTLTKEIWHYWDDAHFAQVETYGDLLGWGQGVHFIPHPYGTIPVVPLRRHRVSDCYWADPWGGPDALHSLLAIYQFLREFAWTAMLQRGQPHAEGEVSDTSGLSPDSVVVAEGFGIAANAANIEGMLRTGQFLLDTWAKTMGLPARTFKLDVAPAMSGVGIIADRAELEDDRRSSEKVARRWERDIITVAAPVYAADAGTTPLPTHVEIEFRRPDIQLTTQETLQRTQYELACGLMSRIEAKRSLHPGMSEDRALELLKAADDERATLAALGQQSAQPAPLGPAPSDTNETRETRGT